MNQCQIFKKRFCILLFRKKKMFSEQKMIKDRLFWNQISWNNFQRDPAILNYLLNPRNHNNSVEYNLQTGQLS